MEQTLKSLEERLSEKPEDKKLKKAVKTLKEDYIPRQEKYENYQKILGDRNNFSKTDTDATFMRMKEDHMKNGQLKPGYNIQAGVENQFIVHYTIHQKPTDWTTLIPHMESFETRYDYFPDNIIADAGYGNEENYTYLSEKPTTSYVKYPGYHKEKRKKRLFFIGESKRRSQTGFVSSYRSYRCENCSGRSKIEDSGVLGLEGLKRSILSSDL